MAEAGGFRWIPPAGGVVPPPCEGKRLSISRVNPHAATVVEKLSRKKTRRQPAARKVRVGRLRLALGSGRSGPASARLASPREGNFFY